MTGLLHALSLIDMDLRPSQTTRCTYEAEKKIYPAPILVTFGATQRNFDAKSSEDLEFLKYMGIMKARHQLALEKKRKDRGK